MLLPGINILLATPSGNMKGGMQLSSIVVNNLFRPSLLSELHQVEASWIHGPIIMLVEKVPKSNAMVESHAHDVVQHQVRRHIVEYAANKG
jgi:hypothetical protein